MVQVYLWLMTSNAVYRLHVRNELHHKIRITWEFHEAWVWNWQRNGTYLLLAELQLRLLTHSGYSMLVLPAWKQQRSDILGCG